VSVRSGADNRNTRILVIDDDEIALQAMTDVLERAGYVVHPLVSPIGATQVIAAHGIAAAVIDLNMPVMRGDRFISLIRSWDRIRDLPIVLVSGESPHTIRNAIAHLPGVAVVTKSHMSELLVSTLERTLSGHVGRDAVPAGSSELSTSRSSPALAAVPSRSLALSARAAQTALRDYTMGRTGTARAVTDALTTLRSEAQQASLQNTTELVALAIELTGSLSQTTRLPPEGEASLTEMLNQLVGDVDKARAFDRSLALTIQRSRLERARQQLR
jgi:CheY-like chemotaxis protein